MLASDTRIFSQWSWYAVMRITWALIHFEETWLPWQRRVTAACWGQLKMTSKGIPSERKVLAWLLNHSAALEAAWPAPECSQGGLLPSVGILFSLYIAWTVIRLWKARIFQKYGHTHMLKTCNFLLATRVTASVLKDRPRSDKEGL